MVLEKILIENGAPTLANLKTASLFTLPVEDDRETQQVLKKWERDLGQKGISIEILRASPQSLLVYVYRKNGFSVIWNIPEPSVSFALRGIDITPLRRRWTS